MNEEPLEVVENGNRSIEAIERAEIDIQIATARRFPRPVNTKAISEQIAKYATANEETARECYYAVPRAGTVIQGASVRLSEIVASCYGNLHIAGRIIDHDLVSRSVTAQAVAWDLQSNVRRTAEWSEPITQKASDATKMTKLVAISKAERNAILKVVPRVIWEPIVESCKAIAIGDAYSLQTRIAKAYKAFAPFGIVPEQILAIFEVNSSEELTQTHLGNLLGMYTALKEGTATIDDLFKPLPKKQTNLPRTVEPNGIEEEQESASTKADTQRPEATAPPASEPSKRPGRPKGSKNKTKDENPPNNNPESKTEPQDENHSSEPSASDPVVRVGVALDNEPKASTIAKIRTKLEEKGISEARLLALMHELKFSENPAQPLEDFDIHILNLVDKRFDQVIQRA